MSTAARCVLVELIQGWARALWTLNTLNSRHLTCFPSFPGQFLRALVSRVCVAEKDHGIHISSKQTKRKSQSQVSTREN